MHKSIDDAGERADQQRNARRRLQGESKAAPLRARLRRRIIQSKPEERPPMRGAFLPALLMYFCSRRPAAPPTPYRGLDAFTEAAVSESSATRLADLALADLEPRMNVGSGDPIVGSSICNSRRGIR